VLQEFLANKTAYGIERSFFSSGGANFLASLLASQSSSPFPFLGLAFIGLYLSRGFEITSFPLHPSLQSCLHGTYWHYVAVLPRSIRPSLSWDTRAFPSTISSFSDWKIEFDVPLASWTPHDASGSPVIPYPSTKVKGDNSQPIGASTYPAPSR